MKYLSDGKSDGFALFYIKDEKLKTVCLNEEQAEELSMMLYMFSQGKEINIKTPDCLENYL